MLRIGVTGASGFIGRHLLAALGTRAVPLIRGGPLVSGTARRLDYEDPMSLLQAARGLDAIVLLGGLAHRPRGVSEADVMRINSIYPHALAEAAAQVGVKTIVYLSSSKVFARPSPDEIVTDDTQLAPSDIYGRSKLEAESRLASIANIRVVSFRPPLIYGEGAKGNLATLAGALRSRVPLPLGAITENRRTLLAVGNLCDAIVVAVNEPIPSGAYVVCDDISLSTRRIVECIAASEKAIFLPVPTTVLRLVFNLAGRTRLVETLLDSFECRAEKFMRLSSWRPRIRPEMGLPAVMSSLQHRAFVDAKI